MAYDVKVGASRLGGHVTIPPSKSMLHRALIAAALAKGTTIIDNFAKSNDIQATLNGIKALGASYKIKNQKITVIGSPRLSQPKDPIDVYQSASTLRFLIPVFGLMKGKTIFNLDAPLAARPQTTYTELFDDKMTFDHHHITVENALTASTYHIKDPVSSQFITGLLFALPLKENNSTIIVKHIPSKAYVDLTIVILKQFGITIEPKKDGYFIPGNQTYKATSLTIDGDYSQAAFFLCAGLFHRNVSVSPLKQNTNQADEAIVHIIRQLGGRILRRDQSIHTTKSSLTSLKLDIDNTPDLAPILALSLSFGNKKSLLTNANRLIYKESNRLETTANILNAIGCRITLKKDTLVIKPIKNLFGDRVIDSHNDHRIAMMLAIAGTIALRPITIKNAQVVDKSYPNFFKDLRQLGASIVIMKRRSS